MADFSASFDAVSVADLCSELELDLDLFGLNIEFPVGFSLEIEGPVLPFHADVAGKLLAQVNGALGPLIPFFDLIDLLLLLKEVLDAVTELNPPKIIAKLVKFTKKLDKLKKLIPQIALPRSIKSIIKVLIVFLKGLRAEIMAIIEAQAKIDLGSARATALGNLDLEAALSCAQANLDFQLAVAVNNAAPLNRLIGTINLLCGLCGLPELPSLTLEADAEAEAMLEPIDLMIVALTTAYDAIPVLCWGMSEHAVIKQNIQRANLTNTFSALWHMTRVMIRAGWEPIAGGYSGVGKLFTSGSNDDPWAEPADMFTDTTSSVFFDDVDQFGFLTISDPNLDFSQSVGCYIVFSGCAEVNNEGQLYRIVYLIDSHTVLARTVDGTTPAFPDANSGAITANLYDPTSAVYPTSADDKAGWLLLRGPTLVRLGITAEPTLLRGEWVKQTQEAGFATGIVRDWVFNGTSGWLVVQPAAGTFQNSLNLVGQTSKGTAIVGTGLREHVIEMVIYKDDTTDYGGMFFQSIDTVSESDYLFSTLAYADGCTETVPPGGGGTDNAFPSVGSFNVRGDPANLAANIAWFDQTPNGNLQCAAANCLRSPHNVQDGTFWLLATDEADAGLTSGMGFFSTVGGEPADVAPYVVSYPCNTATSATSAKIGGTTTGNYWSQGDLVAVDACVPFHSWRRRGAGSDDTYFNPRLLYTGNAVPELPLVTLTSAADSHDAVELVPSISPDFMYWLEAPQLAGVFTSAKQRKGYPRFMRLISVGLELDTFGDGATWLCVGRASAENYMGIVLGPWNDTAAPIPATGEPAGTAYPYAQDTVYEPTYAQADTTPPVLGSNLTASIDGAGNITVAWLDASDDVSAPGNLYYLLRVQKTLMEDLPYNIKMTGNQYTFEGLPNQTYYLTYRAVDEAGNVSDASATTSIVNTVALSPPAIANLSPAAGAVLTSSSEVSFDVTSAVGLQAVVIVATIKGIDEVAYNGTAFRGLYSGGSSKVAITDGYRFTLKRAGGWPSVPYFSVIAVDVDGNMTQA